MSIPKYASHMTQEKFNDMKRFWKVMGDRFYEFPGVKKEITDFSDQDAAALVCMAALDSETIASVEKGGWYSLGLGNDGRTIDTIASLFQYQCDLARDTMKIIFKNIQ